MRRYIIIIFIIYSFCLSGQNLVPNPSFEKYEECPATNTGKPRFILIPDWTMPTMGTSDYFNSCSTDAGVPNNWAGSKMARTGRAYAGFIAMINFNTDAKTSFREYLQAELKTELETGMLYYVKLYVALASSSRYAVNGIGLYFSDRLVDSSQYLGHLSFKPQISIPDKIFHEKETWFEISGKYRAKGGEKYIIIGDFLSNKEIKWIQLNNGSSQHAYYLIDDVAVYPLETESDYVNEREKFFNEIDESTKLQSVYNEIEAIKIEAGSLFTLQNVYFEFDKYDLIPVAKSELDALASLLKKRDTMKLEIHGHTDSIGSYEHNVLLSEKRANAVRDYLVIQGVDPIQLSQRSFADEMPVESNISDIGRAKNRRVEFFIIAQ
ncbi:MAG: OmpA family protein [Bacteroidota bacterium]